MSLNIFHFLKTGTTTYFFGLKETNYDCIPKGQLCYTGTVKKMFYESQPIHVRTSCCSDCDNCNTGEALVDTNIKWCDFDEKGRMHGEMSCPEKGACAVCYK